MKRLCGLGLCFLLLFNTSYASTSSKLFGFYASGSYDSYLEMTRDKSIKAFDGVSFAWCSIVYNDKEAVFATGKKQGGTFYTPDGSGGVLKSLDTNDIPGYLMVYGNMAQFPHRMKDISNNNRLLDDMVKASLKYDGITLDLEFINKASQSEYITFIKNLKAIMESLNKDLVVCVPVGSSFSYYDYDSIFKYADYVILMAHDYEPENVPRVFLGDDPFMAPGSPQERVRMDLMRIKSSLTQKEDFNKGILQISFSVNQYVNQGGYVEGKPYHPTYDLLVKRIDKELSKGQTEETLFHRQFSNPYITFMNDNGELNTVWYEDYNSIKAKEALIEELGLGGLSLWHIGTVPKFDGDYKSSELDVWELISKEYLSN